MDDLVAFLAARLDEDEQAAQSAVDELANWGGPWLAIADDIAKRAHFDADEIGEHIARWDPARVLAEVEAKRRIIDEHEPLQNGCCDTCCEDGPYGDSNQAWPCRTVRLLALPYADHPDYREEWRP